MKEIWDPMRIQHEWSGILHDSSEHLCNTLIVSSLKLCDCSFDPLCKLELA